MRVQASSSSSAEPSRAHGLSLLGTLQLWDAAKTELRHDEMRACLHDEAVVETVA